jgi:hypothetical protein
MSLHSEDDRPRTVEEARRKRRRVENEQADARQAEIDKFLSSFSDEERQLTFKTLCDQAFAKVPLKESITEWDVCDYELARSIHDFEKHHLDAFTSETLQKLTSGFGDLPPFESSERRYPKLYFYLSHLFETMAFPQDLRLKVELEQLHANGLSWHVHVRAVEV